MHYPGMSSALSKDTTHNLNNRTIFHRLIDTIEQPRCLLCQQPGSALCAPCRADLPWLSKLRCPVCALPTPTGAICGHCLRQPPAYDHVLALFAYAFPVNRLIHHLKYHEQLRIAPLLGGLLSEQIIHTPDLWLPMPLHANRLKQRAFNQAVEITRELARQSHAPMHTGLASRVKDTPPQAGLKRDARHRNMRNAFVCNGDVSGMHIGIVDDVMTTGSTLNALAKTLKEAGAKQVSCALIARAL